MKGKNPIANAWSNTLSIIFVCFLLSLWKTGKIKILIELTLCSDQALFKQYMNIFAETTNLVSVPSWVDELANHHISLYGMVDFASNKRYSIGVGEICSLL